MESSHARFDSSHALQFDSSRALQFESSQALQFESSQALTRERAHPGHIRPRKGAESQGSAGGFSGKNASPEHIYQVMLALTCKKYTYKTKTTKINKGKESRWNENSFLGLYASYFKLLKHTILSKT